MGSKVKVAETFAGVSATLTFNPMTLKMSLVSCAPGIYAGGGIPMAVHRRDF